MENVTKENYAEYFDEHRKELNQKIKIDQSSFDKRGLSISIGIVEFYEAINGRLFGRIKYSLIKSDDYDYTNTNINIVIVAKDDQYFVVDQESKSINSMDCVISANAIDEAKTIEVFTTGDIPEKKLIYGDGYDRTNIGNVEFVIDHNSFRMHNIDLVSLGFRKEKNIKKHKSTIFVEIKALPEASFEDYNCLCLCAVLQNNTSIVGIGHSLIVSFGKFDGSLHKIIIEATEELMVSRVKLYLEAQ